MIYGPGDKPCYGPSSFCAAAKKDEQITLWGDGTELREFLYIDDIVSIVTQLLNHPYAGPLNPTQGNSTTFTNILKEIEHYQKLSINQRERTKKKVDNAFDNELMRKLFPSFKFTPIQSGIQKMLEAK